MGLVSQVVTSDQLIPTAQALAERIVCNPARTLRLAKRLATGGPATTSGRCIGAVGGIPGTCARDRGPPGSRRCLPSEKSAASSGEPDERGTPMLTLSRRAIMLLRACVAASRDPAARHPDEPHPAAHQPSASGSAPKMHDNPAISARRADQARLTHTEACRFPRLERRTRCHKPHCTGCAQTTCLCAANLISFRRGGHGSQCKLGPMHLCVTDVRRPTDELRFPRDPPDQ